MSGNLRIARSWVDVHSIASIWSWAPLSWLVEDIEATSFSPRESHTPTQVSAPREKLQRLKLLALAWMVYIYNGSFINLYIYMCNGECPSSIFMSYILHCFSRSIKLILHKCMDHMFDWGPFLQNHQLSPQSNAGSASIRSWEWSGPSPQTDSAWKEPQKFELYRWAVFSKHSVITA